MRFYFAIILLLGCRIGLAADVPQTHALMAPEEQEIYMRARKKLYPGGRDEDPLKVQSQLPQVTRKMAPVTEAPVEEVAPDPSND